MDIPIVPCGWPALTQEQVLTVLTRAAELIPEELPALWPADRLAADERNARQGGEPAGALMGRSWVALALSSQEELCREAAVLVQTHRDGSHRLFENERELLLWAEKEGSLSSLCVLLLGTGISWAAQEALQQGGFYVGRLPFDDPAQVRAYAERLVGHEQQERRLPRRAWIIAPSNDAFTRTLHGLLAESIREILRDEEFPEEAILWVEGERPPGGALPGLVLLLTHGAADASSGVPVV
jgi:hypothetical protein